MLTLGSTLSVLGFELPLDVVIIGAIAGTAYGLFGLGLTLTYQSSRVLNFAQGAMGAVPHVLLASFVLDHGMGYWPALGLALGAGVAAGALIELGVVRRLAKAPRLVVLVATLGAAQLLAIPLTLLVNLSKTKMGTNPYPVPFHKSITIGNLQLGTGEVIIAVVAPLIVVGLTLFLRRTTIGMASRASAENLEAAELVGVPVGRISLTIWCIAGLLAAMAAILLGPTKPTLATVIAGGSSYTGGGDLLLPGLAAAMMGGLLSLPQVFGGGILIGVSEALVRWNYPSSRGLVELVILGVILASLLLRRELRQLARGAEESSWSLAGAVRALPDRLRRHPKVRGAGVGVGAAVLAVALLLPLSAGPAQRLLYAAILVYVIIGLSLVVLTGWAGQVTLGHFTFVALGALIGGRLHQLGYPVYGAVFIAMVGGAVAAVIVGLPALRVRGLFLAVTTLAFAVAVDRWLVGQSWLVQTGASHPSTEIPRPSWGHVNFQNELTFYYLVLAVTVVAVVLVRRLSRTGIARNLQAVRDNEPMAAALAVSPSSTKLLAFVVAGTLATFAGYLYGTLLVNFGGTTGLTAPSFSLAMVTMVVVGGPTSITGAVLGALYVRGLPYFFHSDWALLLSSGAGLLLVLLLVPGGLASIVFRARDRVVRMLTGQSPTDDVDDTGRETRVAPLRLEPAPVAARTGDEPLPLEADNIVVRYGGLTALAGVSLRVDHGEIVGLIGPNGAGKTTLFDVLSGLVRASDGTVQLHGEDVTDLPPERRAELGLARSFQQARLFEQLSVRDVFKVALERETPSELVPSLLGLPPSRFAERAKDERATELVDLLGLSRFADKPAGELSTGTRRIVELGCTIALGADVILLDEPTGGVAQREVEAFLPVLRQIRDHLDATMVIVAHDIPMIVGLCDRVYVLAAGQVIAEGPPSVLQTDEAVIAAYLGTSSTAASAAPTRRDHPVGAPS